MHLSWLFGLPLFAAISVSVQAPSAKASDRGHMQELADIAQRQSETDLINRGVSPQTAYWGAWAMQHQPGAPCATQSAFIRMGAMLYGNEIGALEQSGACTPDALARDAQSRRPANEMELQSEKKQWGVSWDEPNSPYAGQRPQDIKLVYPQEMIEENREGRVTVLCHFAKKNDALWHASNCSVLSSEGGQAFVESTLEYYRRKAWSDSEFTGHPDKNGMVSETQTFSLSSN